MSAPQVSQKDLAGMFVRVVRDAEALGLTSAGWELHTGSRTNGNAFEIRTERGHFERLGMTKPEAYAALYAMARAFEMVVFAREVCTAQSHQVDGFSYQGCDV